MAGGILAVSGEITGREGTYPRVLAGIIIVLALISMRSDYVMARRDEHDGAGPMAVPGEEHGAPAAPLHEEGAEDFEGSRGAGVAWKRVLALTAVTFLAIYLMSWLGFFIPATLLVGGGLIVLGVRTWWKVATYTGGLVVGAYLLFVEALGVPFPPAPWS
ncbi:tripartite tricarboxylate transporter TctB family protein [Blastococcus saxobsidens]|uniref:tripartite tricarboxylate transporter TctB family protein n=1 Tax=Blastococcus saxobsidens TaxID=138336 RepID=UPI001315ABD8|nr:tripartite tricarboxylate transporter TctB family protein [Blastococcus saxobsidens]